MRIPPAELVRLLGPWRNAGSAVPTALANSLSGLILDGRLPVGTRLPAERIMADVLHISRASVVAALNQLRSRDLLSTRHGAGSLVRLPPHTALASVTAWTAMRRHAGRRTCAR